MEEGQSQRPLVEVAAGRFAQRAVISGKIKDVVDDLKGHPKIIAEMVQISDALFGQLGQESGALGGGTEEAGRFGVDALVVVGTVLGKTVAVFELAKLAVDNNPQRVAEQLESRGYSGFPQKSVPPCRTGSCRPGPSRFRSNGR
jgi:hypothetical protein